MMRFILSAVLERTVRFIAAVDVMLEDDIGCLPNNKKLGVIHVLIVFW